VCPSKGPDTVLPFSASQTWIVLSDEPETMDFPLGENATEQMLWECPSKILIMAGQ